MSDDTSLKSPFDGPTDGCDWLLQNIVSLAKIGVGLGVTLSTPAGFVSGTIISGRDYLERMTSSFRCADVHRDIADSLADNFARYQEVLDSDDSNGDGPYFIHLANVRLALSGGLTSAQADATWRGRISEVSGFTIGALS